MINDELHDAKEYKDYTEEHPSVQVGYITGVGNHAPCMPKHCWINTGCIVGVLRRKQFSVNFYNQGVIRKLYISVISWRKFVPSRPLTFFVPNNSLIVIRKSILLDFLNFLFFTAHFHSFIKYNKLKDFRNF